MNPIHSITIETCLMVITLFKRVLLLHDLKLMLKEVTLLYTYFLVRIEAFN